ncbi:MAG: peptidase M15 [Clostridia bacterium]|nr:peptidase M15 [Clostridia bacterium]
MYITKNFTLTELSKTSTGLKNVPPSEAVLWLKILAVAVLQPLRDEINAPLYINSGYRCAAVNKRVGGANSSAHLYGRAADIRVQSERQGLILMDALRENPHVDKCLLEFTKSGAVSHLHVQTSKNPRMIFNEHFVISYTQS